MNSTAFLALSTIDSGKTWTCPVAFAFDEKFNLYFISLPASKHMKNIEKDKHVSAAIYSTKFCVGEDVFGIQVVGEATLLPDDEVPKAYDYYYGRRYPETGKHPERTPKDHMRNATWNFAKIKPVEIYVFDTRHFGHERQAVPKEEYE